MSQIRTPLELVKNVLLIESEAINKVAQRLTDGQTQTLVELFHELALNRGQLVFCGVGKSGMIAKKLAATFCSLGLPSFSLHPVEALHGDLGRVRAEDAIVFISKSGTTEEILKLKPYLPQSQRQFIGLLGNIESPIAKFCGLVFDCSVDQEACLNNQAPTTSTTVAMAMGDAMAVLYEDVVGLSKENFAVHHPAGLLGKALRLRVKDLMVELADCPVLNPSSTLKDALIEMTAKPIGACAVVVNQKDFVGIIVEGDIRRILTKDSRGVNVPLAEMLNSNPVFVTPEDLAMTALEKMEKRERPLNIVPVIDGKEILGFLRLHDLIKEGFLTSAETSPRPRLK
jgi:arabinose-5-phosphate isomerase